MMDALIESKKPKSVIFAEMSLWFVKWLSGFLVGFVISCFGMAVWGYGIFSFVFVVVAIQAMFWKLFHHSSLLTILIVDAVMVFLALLVRFYILVAPGL